MPNYNLNTPYQLNPAKHANADPLDFRAKLAQVKGLEAQADKYSVDSLKQRKAMEEDEQKKMLFKTTLENNPRKEGEDDAAYEDRFFGAFRTASMATGNLKLHQEISGMESEAKKERALQQKAQLEAQALQQKETDGDLLPIAVEGSIHQIKLSEQMLRMKGKDDKADFLVKYLQENEERLMTMPEEQRSAEIRNGALSLMSPDARKSTLEKQGKIIGVKHDDQTTYMREEEALGKTFNTPSKKSGGNLEPGTRWIDPNNKQLGVEVIPGSGAERKIAESAEEKKAAELQKIENTHVAIDKTRIVTTNLKKALKENNMWTTGFIGGVAQFIPGTPAADQSALLSQVKAHIGFEQLSAMRKASPTGGALGQVAVQELNFLQAALNPLTQTQSPEAMGRNAQSILTHYTNARNIMLASVGRHSEIEVDPKRLTNAEQRKLPYNTFYVNKDGKLALKKENTEDSAKTNTDKKGFPSVSSQKQKEKDDKRINILKSELIQERELLKKNPKDADLHKRNIAAIQKELK